MSYGASARNKSCIDRFEVHINTIVKKETYITLTHTHTHTPTHPPPPTHTQL